MTTQPKKVRKMSRKKVTLNEFRAWLEGVEELQDDSWSPSKDQWTTIRQKIDSIIIEERIVEKIVERNIPTPAQAPSEIIPAEGPLEPIMPPLVGVPPGVEMTPAAKAALAGVTPVKPNMPMEGTKTPDLPAGSSHSAFE